MIRAILSTGIGRLYLLSSLESLVRAGADMRVIQGWVPENTPDSVVNLLGKIVGRTDLAISMQKRCISFLRSEANCSCAFADFCTQALMYFSKYGLISIGNAARLGWLRFGYDSRKYLHDGDVFHVRSGAGQGGAIETARARGMKIVVDHSIAHPDFLEVALREEYERAGLPFWFHAQDPFWRVVVKDCWDADVLLVNSDFVKDTFIKSGYPEEKIQVEYLGVRKDFWGIKKNYRKKTSEIHLLFTGSFVYRKGARVIIEALNNLYRIGFCFRLTIVGSTDEATELLSTVDFVSRLDIVGHVPQDKLKSYLVDADIYLFPSFAEGCANSAMEAMAAGLPLITTRETGVPVEHMKNGWIVARNSVEELQKSIQILDSDEALRERFGRNAAKTIADDYSWEQYGQRVVRLYQTLL